MAAIHQLPLWKDINNYLQRAYLSKPKYSYSICSMQPGWNIKYRKSGKSLCTLYPKEKYFEVLIVIGQKEMTDAELMMPALSAYVQGVFAETAVFQDSRWLMLEVKNRDTLLDALELIALRVKPCKKPLSEHWNSGSGFFQGTLRPRSLKIFFTRESSCKSGGFVSVK